MEKAPRQIRQDERRRDAVEVELPLHAAVLRREPHAAYVHVARPCRPGERVFEMNGRSARVDQVPQEWRPEERLRRNDVQSPKAKRREQDTTDCPSDAPRWPGPRGWFVIARGHGPPAPGVAPKADGRH